MRLFALAAALSLAVALDAPQSVRLAFRGVGYDVAVSWNTNGYTQTSTLKWGTTTGVYPNQALGTQSKYVTTASTSAGSLLCPPPLAYLDGCGINVIAQCSCVWGTRVSVASLCRSTS